MTNTKALGSYAAKQCPMLAQNDILQPVEPLPITPFTQRLFDNGNFHEALVFGKLLEIPGTVLITKRSDTGKNGPAREKETLAAMRAGVPIILGGRLPADKGHRVGEP